MKNFTSRIPRLDANLCGIFRISTSTAVLFLILVSNTFAQLNYRWGWQSGSSSTLQYGKYGTKGVASFSNVPGARYSSASWDGPDGRLWLLGGIGHSASGIGRLNDLWQYDPSGGQWTWVSGSKMIDQQGVYGTQGISSADNAPGGRYLHATWTGPNGKLWLFGGWGFDSTGAFGNLNDLWYFDPENGQWTWVSGSKDAGQSGVYGTKGTASSSNVPGARTSSTTWVGPNGKLWLFGGFGKDETGSEGGLNDLWYFDPSTKQWTWVSGAKTRNQAGTYGTKGVADANNVPSARYRAVSWGGQDGELWMMGGENYNSGYDSYNDLWKYDISSGAWTWVGGSSGINQSGSYGTKGVASGSNMPGARDGHVAWTGPGGNFWLFGGSGYDESGTKGNLNDLWKYNPLTDEWTWIRGPKTAGTTGSYGSKGISASGNMPGARTSPVSWSGPDGNFWVFGGLRNGDESNDLWRLDSSPGMLSLDESTNYGRIPDADELDVSSAMTLEMWVKFYNVNRSTTGQEWMALATKGDFSSSYGLMLNTSTSSKTLRFFHNGLSVTTTDFSWTSVAANTWYHVAATYDGGSIALYIDGVRKVLRKTTGGNINATTDDLYIGQNGSGNYRLDGAIGEVHLWDKALSQLEIQDQMNLSLSGKEPGLVGAWLPRAGGRHSALDATGAGNNMVDFKAAYIADFPPIKTAISGSEGWRFLAAPGDTTTYGTLLEPLWTQGFSGSDAGTNGSSNVYFYDESSKSWQTPSNASNVTGTASDAGNGMGKGLLVYVYADDNKDGVDDPFPKTLQLDSFGKIPPVQIPLSYTDSGVYGNDGWHLVANPYPVSIYWQKIVDDGSNHHMLDYAYIWDQSLNSGSGGYRIHYGEPKPPAMPSDDTFDGRIPAFQSFWVKAKEQGANLQLSAQDFTLNHSLYKQSIRSFPYLKIIMKGQGLKDGVSAMFPSGKADAMDPVPKLSSFSSKHAELYLEDEQGQRWIARNFISTGKAESWSIPLNMDATVGGTYRLEWDLQTLPRDWKIVLQDHKRGKAINLRSTTAYDVVIKKNTEKAKQSPEERLPIAPGSTQKAREQKSRFTLQISTAPAQQQVSIPTKVKLSQNYPNPFNPTTNISYDVPETSNVLLRVYDMLGRKVATLVNGKKTAGHYELNFDAHNIASGTYIYRLQVGAKVITKKMTLIK